MATNYLYGTVLTSEAVAANNRGDNLGNTTTLQKVFVKDEVHTSVSAEAIRFAIRYRFQREELRVRRKFLEGKLHDPKEWDETANIDDDLMGYMDAAAAKSEREEDEAAGKVGETASEARKAEKEARDAKKKQLDNQIKQLKQEAKALTKADERAKEISERIASLENEKKQVGKGKATKRQSPLAVGRAVSLRPYRGEISFNAVSGEKVTGVLSLYSAEMHTTEYQYSFGLNLDDVVEKKHIDPFIDAIVDPPQVAGNHSRFAYDFSPASIVLRVTSAHSPRIQNCFEHDEETRGITVRRLIERVKSGDIPANEIIIGGEIASTPDGKILADIDGLKIVPGVREAANEARHRIRERLGLLP